MTLVNAQEMYEGEICYFGPNSYLGMGISGNFDTTMFYSIEKDFKVTDYDPCANTTLTAPGVDARQQIATAQAYIQKGASSAMTSIGMQIGALSGYYDAVHTGGPNDIKNLPGHSPQNPIDVKAGNISFGITCPFGPGFCQFAAGFAQTMGGLPNFNGNIAVGFDNPEDTAAIKIGQAMRAGGCHE